MGVVETGAQKLRRKRYLQQAVLAGLVVGGMVLMGAVPVGLPIGKRNKYRFRNQVKTTLSRLAQKGLVTFIEKDGARYARITPAGKKMLEMEEQKKALQLQKQKRWDKRWRVIIFDIPEYRRGTRDKLRLAMKGARFYRLQDSVWLYPYDCEDFVTLLKADLKIGNAILYMVVEKIENDAKIMRYFKFA